MSNHLNLVVTEENFVTLAMRTNSNTTGTHTEAKEGLALVITPDILHATLGINDEFYELADAIDSGDTPNIVEELGDLQWFIALLTHSLYPNGAAVLPARSHDFGDVCEATLLRKTVGDITSYVKKAYAYGKMSRQVYAELGVAIVNLVFLLNNLATRLDVDPLSIRQTVIDKLVKRFGDKYTDEQADLNNRDLEGEREVLEKAVEGHDTDAN